MDPREIGFGGVDWIHQTLRQGLVTGSSEHSNEPLGSIKCGEFID
jgi:hypothetical protein